MQTVLIVIHLMVVLALVAVVLLQRSEGGGLGIGGGSSGFMTGRGQTNLLTRTIMAAGYGIDLGDNFLDALKAQLRNLDALVLFVLTKRFYASPISLCEMGATWVLAKEHIPILVPPFDFDDVKGVIPLTQGFKLNDALKLNLFKTKGKRGSVSWPGLAHVAWERNATVCSTALTRIVSTGHSIQRECRDLPSSCREHGGRHAGRVQTSWNESSTGVRAGLGRAEGRPGAIRCKASRQPTAFMASAATWVSVSCRL